MNISFCFQMHAPNHLKRYRFFDIGQDHYYYDDMQNEDHTTWLVEKSYLPLCRTLSDMVRMSHGKFHCALSVSGVTLEMFQQYAPEMIDIIKELVGSKCVELVVTPFAYSLAAEYNMSDFEDQLRMHAEQIEGLFGVKPSVVWNTELLYSDEIAYHVAQMGYKAMMTEGAKHILSWKSPNYVYSSASSQKLRVLLRNNQLSDELSFHFSDPNWKNQPFDAEHYAQRLAELPKEEQIVNIWVGAETFGIVQSAETGIFDFLRAMPFFALEREIGFVTPTEAIKKNTPADTVSVPYPITWTGEAKDLATFNGNYLQQEAIQKLYAVAERVKLCSDKRLKRDWLMLQDVSHLLFMNHQTTNHALFESSYDAFTNYMNVLADFLQMVEEQYPSTIENEELNELLKTINNQEKEIASLEAQLKRKNKKAE